MKRTVVVVDDSKFIIKQITEFFEQQLGFSVLATGSDGNEAIELYQKYKPDLITLDISMPNKLGVEAINDILHEFPDANILMISAVRGNTMLKCMSSGAKGYIEKPLKMGDDEFRKDFQDTVEKIFSSSS